MNAENDEALQIAASSPEPGLPEETDEEFLPLRTADTRGDWPRSLLWLVFLIAVYLGQSLPYLSRIPRAIMDESWESCTGYALAYEGKLRNPVVRNRHGIDRAFVQPRVTQSVVLAAAYRLLGFSLTSGRIASVTMGILSVIGTFYLMRTWLSHRAAGLIALLFALETQFFTLSRTIRPEVYLLCASIWTLAFLARATVRQSLVRFLFAGVIGGVGCYTHPNMVIFAFLGIILILHGIGFTRRTLAAIACYGLGGIVAVIPFLAWATYASAQHDVSITGQLGDWYKEVHDDTVIIFVAREIHRWIAYLRPLHRTPWVLAITVGAVAALIRRHPIQVWALVLMCGHAVLLPLINRMSSDRYLLVLAPWFAALIGLWVIPLWNWAKHLKPNTSRRFSWQMVAAGSAAICLAINLAGSAYLAWSYRNADYDGICRRIAQNIPPGARVYGYYVFWAGLHQYPYMCDVNEEIILREEFAKVMQEHFNAFNPQYVIQSSDRCWALDGVKPRPAERKPPAHLVMASQLSWDELDVRVTALLLKNRHGVLLDQFTTPDFGKISVYHLQREPRLDPYRTGF